MLVYRFLVWFEDNEDIQRRIEIRADQTFEDLHNAILASVEFDNTQLASFYLSDDLWEKGEEISIIDMEEDGSMPIMGTTELREYVTEIEQKFIYVYDFVLMWNFRLEVEEMASRKGDLQNLPLLIETIGAAPKQYETIEKYPERITEEDDKYVEELREKNFDYFHNDDDDENGEEDGNWEDFDLDEFEGHEDDAF